MERFCMRRTDAWEGCMHARSHYNPHKCTLNHLLMKMTCLIPAACLHRLISTAQATSLDQRKKKPCDDEDGNVEDVHDEGGVEGLLCFYAPKD